jgi:hypothetical protein
VRVVKGAAHKMMQQLCEEHLTVAQFLIFFCWDVARKLKASKQENCDHGLHHELSRLLVFCAVVRHEVVKGIHV